jgi:PadR family transcriptional regulator, regulatory protein AphA
MSREKFDDLTPTSYAMLGLLSLRPYTTYELATQMQRSIRWFWPRAVRKLYDEPKRLAARGLASVRTVMTGRRAGSVYEITAAGRDALRTWIGEAAFAPPEIQMEAMIHLFFADSGTPAQLVDSLRLVATQAEAQLAELGSSAREIATGPDEFPARRATNAITMELYVRINETIRDWSSWAEHEVSTWPPVKDGRRAVAAGPPARGTELFADIARRAATVDP